MRLVRYAVPARTSSRGKAANIIPTALAVVLAISIGAAPAAADERRRGYERERHEAWRGDIHRFHEHDLDRWSSGRWHQGHHYGRFGWWWIVGGVWYYYPVPVYPYPNPYQPPVVAGPPAPPATQYWYWCPNPAGYYPYIARCATNWQRVPASPPPGVPR